MKKSLLLLLLASTILTFLLFLPFSRFISNALPNSVDPLLYAWNLAHNTQSATHKFSDLLDTNIFYPETNTLAFSDTLYAQTLMTAPIIVLTKNPILAENLYILSTFPIAAIAMFFLSYYLTQSTWASMISAFFYAFSYPRLAQIGHLPALSSQWLPLFFLFLIKYIRQGKFINLVLMFLWYLISIASTVYFGVFLIPLGVIILLFEGFGTSFQRIFRIVRDGFILLLPAVILIILVLFPYIRLRAEYPGIRRSLEDSAKLSAAPADYVSVLPTSWLGGIGFPTNTNEHPLYPTFTLVALALLALIVTEKKHRKTMWGFALVTAFAFLLSFGPYANLSTNPSHAAIIRLPYYYLYKIFPLLQSIRVPARFSIFVILGLAVCSAFSLSKLFRTPRSIGIGIIVVMIYLSEIWQVRTPFVFIPLWNKAPPVYHFIANQPANSIIVELPLRNETSGNIMEHQLMLGYNDLTELDTYATEAYRTYFSAFHGKRMLNGYSGYFPNIYHDHASTLTSFPSEESIDMLQKAGVRYILLHGNEYDNDRFAEIELSIPDYPMLKKVQQFGNDYVYELDALKSQSL